MLRLGIIGVGVHGLRYVRHAMQDVHEIQLGGVCRRDAATVARIATECGVRGWTDPVALLDDPSIDAVAIVTPPASHLPLARLALERRKPVLLEKPLTQTLAEARALADVVASTRTPLFLAQTLRYSESLLLARRELHRIGEVRSLTASQRLPQAHLDWQDNPTPEPFGAVLNTGVHLFDLVRWILGAEFERIFCHARRVENALHDDLFKAQATLRGRPTLVALEIAKVTQSRSSNLELIGEHGQLWVDYHTDEVTLVAGQKRVVLRQAAPVMTLPRVLRDFARCVEGGEPMPITVQDGVRTLEVVDACYRSIQTGQPELVQGV